MLMELKQQLLLKKSELIKIRMEKKFKDITELKNYLTSAKIRIFHLTADQSKEYPALVLSLTVRSMESSKRLVLCRDWECYFCDLGGDMGAQEFYEFSDLQEMVSFLEEKLGQKLIGEILEKTNFDWLDIYYKVRSDESSLNYQRYLNSWELFKKDWSQGKLYLKDKSPSRVMKYGW